MPTARRSTAQPGDRDLLARTRLLRGLPAAELGRVARACVWRSYDAGAVILAQDAPARDVSFLVAGRVRVTVYSRSGREIAFRDLGPGASFGEVSAVDGAPRSASVVALGRTRLAHLPRERFRELWRTHPAVAEATLRELAALVRSLTERVVDTSTLTARSRIQAELLRLARDAAGRANRAAIAPVLRHADIAGRVSTTREAVAREFARLARLGLIARGPRALVVADIARLAELVERSG